MKMLENFSQQLYGIHKESINTVRFQENFQLNLLNSIIP